LTYGSNEEPESITGPFGNQWYFKDEETFAEDHGMWFEEFYDFYYGYDDYYYDEDDEYYSEEPAFFTFIVEEEALNTWGMLFAYEEDMSDLTLMTST